MTKLMKKSLLALMTVGMAASLVAFPAVALAEGTDETEITESEAPTEAPVEAPAETEAPVEAPVETEAPVEAPVEEVPSKEPVVKTGDSSASVVFAVTATAVVAALGMTFVMKKSR